MQECVIKSIHHVSMNVSNTERALDFYCGVLGLKTMTTRPDLSFPGAWLELGNCEIHLLELDNPAAGLPVPEHGGRDRHFAMLVDDLDFLMQALDQAGVGYTRSKSGRRALFCRDPDDNALEFIETEK